MQLLKVMSVRAGAQLTTPDNFITTHSGFTSHDILRLRNVMLYSLTADSAYFVRIDEKEDILNPRKHPFVFLSLPMLAQDLLRMPIFDFIQFTRSIDVNHINVVWMFHTNRCGSTAYAQVFNALPDWTTISEVQPLFAMFETHTNILEYMKSSEFESLTEAMVKFNLKSVPAMKQNVFFKASILEDHWVGCIRKKFPKHQFLFAYRNVKPAGKSFYNGIAPFYFDAILALSINPFSQYYPASRQRIMCSGGYLIPFVTQLLQQVRPHSYVEWYTLQWSVKMHLFCREFGNDILTLRYEELRANQMETLGKMFDYLGISGENIQLAVEALKPDSQEGTPVSQKARAANPQWIRKEDEVVRCNSILKAFNLPDFDSDFDYDDWVSIGTFK